VTPRAVTVSESNFEPSGCFKRLGLGRDSERVQDSDFKLKTPVITHDSESRGENPRRAGPGASSKYSGRERHTSKKKKKNFPCPGIPCHRNKKLLSGDLDSGSGG
jgi:hypothetical protein